jgi:hypothetical protein
MTTAQESAVTAISINIGCPVTLTQAMRLESLWAVYYAAALRHYGSHA